MKTSQCRAALAAVPVALGLLLAGPAVGTAGATTGTAQTQDCYFCTYYYHHHHHHHHHLLGLHLGLGLILL